MKTNYSFFFGAVAVGMLVAGCATHPPQVNCEGHLQPINAPAPKASESYVPAESTVTGQEPR